MGICSFTFYPSFQRSHHASDLFNFLVVLADGWPRKFGVFFNPKPSIFQCSLHLFLVLNRENLAGQLHGELELSGAPSRGNLALRGQE